MKAILERHSSEIPANVDFFIFWVRFDSARSALRRPRTNSEDRLDGPFDGDDATPTAKMTTKPKEEEEDVEVGGAGSGALARYNSMGTLLTPKDTEEFVETLQVGHITGGTSLVACKERLV